MAVHPFGNLLSSFNMEHIFPVSHSIFDLHCAKPCLRVRACAYIFDLSQQTHKVTTHTHNPPYNHSPNFEKKTKTIHK